MRARAPFLVPDAPSDKGHPDTPLHAAIRLSRRLTPHILAALRLGAPKSLSKGTAASTAAANWALDLLEDVLLPRHWAACAQELKLNPGAIHLPKCPSGAAAPSKAVTRGSPCKGSAIGNMKAMEELLRPLAYQGGKCVPRALMMGIKLASEELSSRSGSRGGASASSAGSGLVLWLRAYF